MTTRAATDPLTLALLNMASRSERTHCSDPTSHHLWLSEHEQERVVAVQLCDHCPSFIHAGRPPNNATNTGASGAAVTSASGRAEERGRILPIAVRSSEIARKHRARPTFPTSTA
jgi:hypothetical protein